ncbi:MAG TPA: DUF805 domain-containing protein [Verrucomicrobiae bacterium]
MSDSTKLRLLSGWSILLLGALLFVALFMAVILRTGQSPTAAILGLFGLFAVGVGVALARATHDTLSDASSRRLGVALASLVFAAGGGFAAILAQRTSFFDGLGSLHATLVLLFAALLGMAVYACASVLRQGAAAFLAPSKSFISLGGSIDPVSFLVLQPAFLIFTGVIAGLITAEAGGTRDGLLLAIALGLAAFPLFLTVEVAICAKRWRDPTPMSSLFSFHGRIPRRAFWLISLGLMEIDFLVAVVLRAVGRGMIWIPALLVLLWFPFVVAVGLSTSVRRWHDRGKSGLMVLVALIPIVGPIWAFIETGLLRGMAGANQYGDDPLRVTDQTKQ